jgi:hypothetical protein
MIAPQPLPQHEEVLRADRHDQRGGEQKAREKGVKRFVMPRGMAGRGE